MRTLARMWSVAAFVLYYVREMTLANLRVAHDVLTPGHRSRPGFLIVPTKARTDLELMTLANLITMTPGTLTVDVSPDRESLYIHAMFLDDPETLRRQVAEDFEPRVLRMFR